VGQRHRCLHLGQGDPGRRGPGAGPVDGMSGAPSRGRLSFPGSVALVRTVLDQGGDEARKEVRRLPFDTPISKHLLTGADAIGAGQTGHKLKAERLVAAAETGLAATRAISGAASCSFWPHHGHRWTVGVSRCGGCARHSPPSRVSGWCRSARSAGRRCGIWAKSSLARPLGGSGLLAVPPLLFGIGVTAREVEVLAQVAGGRSNRDIAEPCLCRSARSKKEHVERILMKTGATRLGLAELARRASIQPANESA
jgi:DNA-binding CsgD family transcriptional regulator